MADRISIMAPPEPYRALRHVLLVAYGGGHITMVAPVLRELERAGIRCTLMALTTGYCKACQLGLAPVGYRDFIELIDNFNEVAEWGERLAGANSHPEVDPAETRIYMGVNYMEWVRAYGHEEAAQRYARLGRRGFMPRNFMQRLLAHLRPDAVVTTNSPRTEQAVIEAAVAQAVPVLSMIDLFALPYDPYLKRTVHADRIAVISDFVKDNVVKAGIDARRVVVTGNPAFDSLATPQVLSDAHALRRRLGWEGKQVVLLAGQLEELPDTPEHWKGPQLVIEVERLLRRWVHERTDRALVVRYHPNEFQAFPDLGAHPRVHRSHPLREALHPVLLASDAVVVQTSTVGLEAIMGGCRLLSLAFSPAVRPDGWDYGGMGLATSVPAPQDLLRLLEASLAMPARGAGTFHVGQAGQKVAREVLSLIADEPKPMSE